MNTRSGILSICLEDKEEFNNELKKKQDEFLDLYSLYRQTGLSYVKDHLLLKAYELHLLNPQFTFHI